MSAHETTSPGEHAAVGERGFEVLGVLATAGTVLLGLALGSFDAGTGKNLIGPAGDAVAGTLTTAFGLAAWLLPVELGLLATRLFLRRYTRLGIATFASTLIFLVVACALLHLALGNAVFFGGQAAGGAIGELIGEVLRTLLGVTGTIIIGATVLVVTAILRTPWSLAEAGQFALRTVQRGWQKSIDGIWRVWDAWKEARELEAEERQSRPVIVGIDDVELRDETYERDEEDDEGDEDYEGEYDEEEYDEEASETGYDEEEDEPVRARKGANEEPKIVAPVEHRQEPIKIGKVRRKTSGDFVLPPTTLLDAGDSWTIHVDPQRLRENAERLTEKLAAYGVQGRVDEIHPGPVVTMYEFEPRSGTKVSKIAGLADDLAMALAAQKVRIVAPIPGKARVGFELPNENRKTVFLREILDDRRWQEDEGTLPIALGKDIAGQPVYADLTKMPHLLVAGATGSGKSVGLNVMIASILAKKTPDEVRMLMVDPKVVELQVFDGIPHMLLPVVTDMKKAALSLKWAVDEMERRYQLFADAGTRSIVTYNKRVARVQRGELSMERFFPKRRGKVRGQDADGNPVFVDAVDGERPDALDAEPEKLPFVVVVVDEFADLMMTAAKDVEACIARLAQKARAAGIHVILATQRPSVDVITGMIKANFPARIAFKVSQRQDSMTILGRQGAEHLLGMGDMLMLPPGSSDLRRVHAAYVSEDEVGAICEFLREQGEPIYQTDILKPRDDEGSGSASDDPLYDKAVVAVANAGYCSISHVQRQLSVGYNKAAKLVERMEEEGVVGPPSSKAGGRREVLVGAL